MADNILTYILELQDKISPKLKVINISNDKMLEKWSEVQVKMNAARKSIPDTGDTTKLSPRIGRIGRMGCKLLLERGCFCSRQQQLLFHYIAPK